MLKLCVKVKKNIISQFLTECAYMSNSYAEEEANKVIFSL